MSVAVVTGRTVVALELPDVDALVARHDRVVADVGTGDGRYAYGLARANPATLVIGIDAIKENLQETAARAGRKPARGGLGNVVFVWASAEDPPAELHGRADAVQVVLPWGRLMVGLLLATPDVLGGLRRLGRVGTSFTAVINAEVWGDPVPLEVRDLPELTTERVTTELAPRYEEAGIAISDARLLDEDGVRAVRSTWSKRLASSRSGRPRFVEVVGTYL